MTLKVKHILLRSILGILLAFFLTPFMMKSAFSDGHWFGVNGLGLSIGAKSPITTQYTFTDPRTGEARKITLGDAQPEPFAAIAVVAALLALIFTFLKGATGWVSPCLGSAVCAASFLLLKITVDQDILKNGFGVVAVRWEWGFWSAFSVAVAAAVVSCVPTKRDSVPSE